MKPKKRAFAKHHRPPQIPDWTAQGVGLRPDLYAAALRHLFDRPLPRWYGDEWYWDEPDLEATALDWTRIQTVLFANAADHLAPYNDEQVGMGLNYLMNNGVSDVPFAVMDASVPVAQAMQMMQAMPTLWRHGIGPRLAELHAPIGSSKGRLAFVCHMWFDVWPALYMVRKDAHWQDAVWHVLQDMLDTPCREVQVAALHGIGHCGAHLDRQAVIDKTVDAFIHSIDTGDEELKNYADAARRGCVL